MDLEISLPTFFYFEHLPMAEAKNAIQELGIVMTDADVMEIYEKWLHGFWRKSYSYYRAQLLRYRTIVEQKFYRRHNIPDGDPIYELEEEWEAWMSHVDMQRYMADTNLRLSQLEDKIKDYDFKKRARIDAILTGLPESTRLLINTNLDERWFLKAVDFNSRIRQRVTGRSYETYLSSQDWRKVRAAIILIYEARCQDLECYNTLDRWYLDDADLNVHHITYANLGQERFSDLTLLCRRHHEYAHSGE